MDQWSHGMPRPSNIYNSSCNTPCIPQAAHSRILEGDHPIGPKVSLIALSPVEYWLAGSQGLREIKKTKRKNNKM